MKIMKEEEQKYYTLKKAIQDGIDSGIAVNFNPKSYLNELKKAKKKNG